MRKLVTGLAFAALSASVSNAADLPLKAPSAVQPALYNWTGFYAGGNLGYDWGQVNWSYFGDPTQTVARRPEGPSVGVHLGAQYQVKQFLIGVEGSWSGSLRDIDDRGLDAPIFAARFDSYARIVNVWTIGPRVGWVFSPQWMVFATGGYAESVIESAFILRPNVAAGSDFRTGTHHGWFAGGGVEYLFNNYVYAGLEYRHVELDTVLQGPPTPLPIIDVSRQVSPSFDVVQVRLGFKITPGQARPLVR
jgi:outer membrane immunogenic protein